LAIVTLVVVAIVGIPLAYMRSMYAWEIAKGVRTRIVVLRFAVSLAIPGAAILGMIVLDILTSIYEENATLETILRVFAVVMVVAQIALFFWRPYIVRYRFRGR
jgi:hypothetical protein